MLRWERQWHDEGQPFRDPVDYPAAAVATSGTHDTEPMVDLVGGGAARRNGRRVLAIPSVRERLDRRRTVTRAIDAPDLPHAVREALLESLYASGADLLILPVQDVFGWRDRINQPATVGDEQLDVAAAVAGRPHLQPSRAAMAVADQLREWADAARDE